jgi:hypothetical protein
MKVGDLVKRIRSSRQILGILIDIEINPYLLERDGSQGAWYHIHTLDGFSAHRLSNLEIVSEM